MSVPAEHVEYDATTCRQRIEVAKQALHQLLATEETFKAVKENPASAKKKLDKVKKRLKVTEGRITQCRQQKHDVAELLKLNAKGDTTQQTKLQNILDKLRSDKGILLGTCCLLGCCPQDLPCQARASLFTR